MSAIIDSVERQLNLAKDEVNHYKEHGEFFLLKPTDEKDAFDELSLSIPELSNWIFVTKNEMKKFDSYLSELERMLKTASSDSKYLTLSQKAKHSTFLTMKGDIQVPLTNLLNYHDESLSKYMNSTKLFFGKDSVNYFSRIVMKKLLENYLSGYPIRKPYIGKMRSIVIEPEHIIIVMDTDMQVITDLFCPWFFASKDYDSVMHFDINISVDNRGLELAMNDEPYGFILMDFEKEIQLEKATVESYFKVHRNIIWIHECKMMITILLRLGFGAYNDSSNVFYENLLTVISEKFMYILEEGVVLTHDLVHKFLIREFQAAGKPLPDQENLEMVCKILEVLASERGADYQEVIIPNESEDGEDVSDKEPLKFTINIKNGFERDIAEILDIIKQYV
jgi:chaperonin cofactor prefoldin